MTDAPAIYLKLVKDHGMPECPTLLEMNNIWYETPDEVDTDANDPLGTNVFRPLPPDVAAKLMADYATQWAGRFYKGDLPDEPVARLTAIQSAAQSR